MGGGTNMANESFERVPENADEDFYVVRNQCMRCGTPHVLAPDLMNDDKTDFVECYFRRQPTNEKEEDQAIEALSQSEIEALRYAGTNPRIIAAIRARDCGHLCDRAEESDA
jgi:hypothetical protein